MLKIAAVIDRDGRIIDHGIIEERNIPLYESMKAELGLLVFTRDLNDANFLADVKDSYDPPYPMIASWLIESVYEAKKFRRVKEYPISKRLYKAAEYVYNAENIGEAASRTIEFVNTYCK